MRARALALASVAGLVLARPVLAETPVPPKQKEPDPPPPPSPPDPIVDAAADANLEPTDRHQGLNFTAALGAGFTVGIGIDNSVGRGPSASFRLASMARPRIALTAEIASVTLLHRQASMGPIERDQDSNLLIGAQFYAKSSLWVRIAAGVGVYTPSGGSTLAGPAGVVGVGVDILRRRRLSFGLEYMSIGMINRDGFLSSNAFMVDLAIE